MKGYAHCNNPRCPGHSQERVEAVRRETSHTYRERGGNAPGVESSYVTLHFADPDEAACPHCSRNREVSDQPRKSYAPLSGHDPMGLLGVPGFDARKQQEVRQAPLVDPEREALEAQNRELMERLAAQEARLAALETPSEAAA